MFRHGSPPQLKLPSQQALTVTDVDVLCRELRATKDELEETRNELSELNEARDVSLIQFAIYKLLFAPSQAFQDAAAKQTQLTTK
jgi:hypothetical protein